MRQCRGARRSLSIVLAAVALGAAGCEDNETPGSGSDGGSAPVYDEAPPADAPPADAGAQSAGTGGAHGAPPPQYSEPESDYEP
jgi:hypothetical protein